MTTFISRLNEYETQRGMRWMSNFTLDKTLARAGSDSDKYNYLRNKQIYSSGYRSGYASGS